MDVLETLADATRALSLSEIASAVGGSKSAIFAMLQTLSARGIVRSIGQDQSRQYRLGLGLARLGDVAIGQVSFRDAALIVLTNLSAVTGLTSRAAAWGDDCAVAIARVSGGRGVEHGLRMGNRELLHCTGVGKAMLFTFPDDNVRSLLTMIPLTPRTSHILVTVADLLADLAVSVTRVKSAITADEVAQLGTASARHAAMLSADLGWKGPSLDEADTRAIVGINGLGSLWGCSAAVSAFVDQVSGGSIVNIGSIHGRASSRDRAVYEFTKGGIDALSRGIAVTYGPFGIRANTVAAVVAFLLSPEASYVSGESIAVDGAWSAVYGTFRPDEDPTSATASRPESSALTMPRSIPIVATTE